LGPALGRLAANARVAAAGGQFDFDGGDGSAGEVEGEALAAGTSGEGDEQVERELLRARRVGPDGEARGGPLLPLRGARPNVGEQRRGLAVDAGGDGQALAAGEVDERASLRRVVLEGGRQDEQAVVHPAFEVALAGWAVDGGVADFL